MAPAHLLVASTTIFCLLFHYPTNGQDLSAVECNARLSTARAFSATMFDGEDTIYVFGGYDGLSPPGTQTFKYSISEDTLTPTAGQPPVSSQGGKILMDATGNIYYLLGYAYIDNNYEEDIFQYVPDTQNFTGVGNLHIPTFHFGLVQPNADTALIIGGYGDSNIIQTLNLSTLESEKLNEIPKYDRILLAASAIWVEEQGLAFIFDGRPDAENVTKFDVSRNQSEILPNYFPTMTGVSQSVWDGRFGYVVGGFGNEVPNDSIVQFDPSTGDSRFISVSGHPGKGQLGFQGTSAVYVERLNRIYMVGGYSTGSSYSDKIWYINLDPISTPEPTTNNPTTTVGPVPVNCIGLGDALYPFPGNCDKFVLCRDDQAYGFDCPEPLLFHQTGLRCTWSDLVNCV